MKRNFKLMGLSRMRSIIPSSRGEFHFFMTNRYQRFTDGTGISAGSSTPTTANGSNISVVANGLFPFPMSMHSIQVGAVAPTTTISAGHAGQAFKCGLPVFELSELPSYIQTNIRWLVPTMSSFPIYVHQGSNIIPRRLGGGRDGIADGTNPDPDFGGERRRGEGERRDDEGEGEGGGGEDPPAGPQSGYSFIEFEMFAELLGQSPSDELYADYRGFQRWCEENNYAMTAANYNIWVSLGRP